jgi:hypothetical protein
MSYPAADPRKYGTAIQAAGPSPYDLKRPSVDHGEPPENELGKAVDSLHDFTGLLPWGMWVDDVEHAPQLKWPNSITVYDDMANDAQCQGLYLGATAAIQRYAWYIEPNGCPMRWVKLLAADLNLPIGLDEAKEAMSSAVKRARLRTKKRFSWYNHIQTALKAMKYGHYYFEQVGDITREAPGGGQMWRLRKLSPRHPRTITEILVASDGGLIAVKQGYGGFFPGLNVQSIPPIPIDQLVCYIWDQEPGNWVGRSMYRPMYRNYLVKDRLLRVDAIKHERNGVGMPIIEAPEGATKADIIELDRMAQEYKVGERGGGALPYGAKLILTGTTGTLPDTIASIRFQNEEMARSMLMMFMQLGQTETGSRALGKSFIDWFGIAQEMIADWLADTANEHIIEDWWDWNVDANADQTPLISYWKGEEADPTTDDFGPAGNTLPKEAPSNATPPAGGSASASGASFTDPDAGAAAKSNGQGS